jgi:hypothetical protein
VLLIEWKGATGAINGMERSDRRIRLISRGSALLECCIIIIIIIIHIIIILLSLVIKSCYLISSPPPCLPPSPEDVYHPVHCAKCGSEVGVLDADEVYHFFHAIPGEA